MKRLWKTTWVCWLALGGQACTSQTIYLSQIADQRNQVVALKQAFVAEGYDVELTQVVLPDQNSEVVIAKNPGFFAQDYLQRVEGILQANGLSDISIVTFGEGNHFYSDNNIGIYLPNTLPQLPPVMHAQECGDYDAILEATPNRQVQIELTSNLVMQDQEIILSGNYLLESEQRGEVELGVQQFSFVVRHTEVPTYAGLRSAVELEVLQSTTDQIPQGCLFITVFD